MTSRCPRPCRCPTASSNRSTRPSWSGRRSTASWCCGSARAAPTSTRSRACSTGCRPSWLASADRDDPHTLVNAFGIALGDLLIARLPSLRWCAYADASGPELVLSHPVHELVVFPISSVARQWGHADDDWFARYADDVTDGARSILGDEG
ncbi:DUF3806 domain-containing protein [Cellulomonas soli]